MPERRLSRRGKQPASGPFPRGRRVAPCPGYGFTAVCGSGSPNRCAASPPGNSATLRSAPGAARCALPGATGSPPSAGLVARTDAQHRLREILPLCALLPGAARCALPGLRVLAIWGFCSPDKALAAIRETSSTAPFLRAFCINHPVQPRHHDRHDHRYAQGHQANFAEDIGINRQRL